MQSHALNSKKKFKYYEDQHHLHVCQIVNILIFIKWKIPLILGYNNLKWCTPICQGTKENFWSSKKKLANDKVIPNHVKQNRVLDMANFEINFLSNHN